MECPYGHNDGGQFSDYGAHDHLDQDNDDDDDDDASNYMDSELNDGLFGGNDDDDEEEFFLGTSGAGVISTSNGVEYDEFSDDYAPGEYFDYHGNQAREMRDESHW